MADRDAQPMSITRPTLLVVTGVGVGLLTLTYVLGVQVGKQSAALRKASPTGSGEELQAMPVPLAEQLRQLEAMGSPKPPAPQGGQAPATAPAEPAPRPEAADPKPVEPKAKPADAKPAKGDRWTLQLVSTPDKAEAKRIVARASAAGFAAVLMEDKGAFKVRLSKPVSRESADALAERLKSRGFKAFPVKTE